MSSKHTTSRPDAIDSIRWEWRWNRVIFLDPGHYRLLFLFHIWHQQQHNMENNLSVRVCAFRSDHLDVSNVLHSSTVSTSAPTAVHIWTHTDTRTPFLHSRFTRSPGLGLDFISVSVLMFSDHRTCLNWIQWFILSWSFKKNNSIVFRGNSSAHINALFSVPVTIPHLSYEL